MVDVFNRPTWSYLGNGTIRTNDVKDEIVYCMVEGNDTFEEAYHYVQQNDPIQRQQELPSMESIREDCEALAEYYRHCPWN